MNELEDNPGGDMGARQQAAYEKMEKLLAEHTKARKELAKELKQANMDADSMVEAYKAMDKIVDQELYQ